MTPPPRLVPELYCRDLKRSLRIYTRVFGFSVVYERVGFAMLDLGGARLMLEEIGPDAWLAAPAEPPFGRGMHLEIAVEALGPLLERAAHAGLKPFRAPEEAWYRAGDVFVGQRQAVFEDPDGYLLRFAEETGRRSVAPGGRVVT